MTPNYFPTVENHPRGWPALPAPPLPAAFGEQLATLYRLAQNSTHVFASPLGSFRRRGIQHQLPRFVYFGPDTSDASIRLALLAGLDQRDLSATLALLHFIEGLACAPDLGQQLNLSFFPLIDVVGGARALARENWATSEEPELRLLEKDFRERAYDGFLRFESTPDSDVIAIRLRTAGDGEYPTPPVELLTTDDLPTLDARWETGHSHGPAHGPLTIAADLISQPFELTFRLPSGWDAEQQRAATASILQRFLPRYRAFRAYGQHL